MEEEKKTITKNPAGVFEKDLERTSTQSAGHEQYKDKKEEKAAFRTGRKKQSVKFRNALMLLSFPVFLVGILGPLEIYTGNWQDFPFTVHTFFWMFFAGSLILLLVGSFLFSLIPEKMVKPFQTGIFAITIMAYVQGLFLNRKLIQDDGSALDWQQLKNYSYGNLAVWLLGIVILCVISVMIKEKAGKIICTMSACLAAVLLLTSLSLLIPAFSYEHVSHNYILSGEHQFELAKEDNIIVILLDRYANEEFEQLLEEDLEAAKAYRDFTYYNNADSGYNYTFPSMAHMLTGQEVDTKLTREEWTNQIWQAESCRDFYQKMHENGYTCNLFSDVEIPVAIGSLENVAGSFDNVVECQPRIDYGLTGRLLLKMTVYKYAPYLLKPRFEVAYNAFQQAVIYDREDGTVRFENSLFYEKLREQGLSVNEEMKKQYSFIHLSGLHSPYHTAENGCYIEESGKQATKKGIQIMLQTYMQELKDSGKYEDATLIITSDHGMNLSEHKPQPLFLIKQQGEHHEVMQVNSAPISHDDYLATILAAADIDADGAGTSIFDWEADDERLRKVWYPYSDSEIICYEYQGDRNSLCEKMEHSDYTVAETLSDWHW